MLEKCLLTVLELILNQRLGHRKTKLNICHHMLTSSTQLQNRSFHVVERTRTSTKCQKMKNARAKRAKILFFIAKYAHLWIFCCRRRRGCLNSLLFFLVGVHLRDKSIKRGLDKIAIRISDNKDNLLKAALVLAPSKALAKLSKKRRLFLSETNASRTVCLKIPLFLAIFRNMCKESRN